MPLYYSHMARLICCAQADRLERHMQYATMQVKSVLSAALYPNVAVMDDGGGPNARPTWHDGQGSVIVHPSSVNHPLIAVQYMRPYLIYLEKVRACPTFLSHPLGSWRAAHICEKDQGTTCRRACLLAYCLVIQQMCLIRFDDWTGAWHDMQTEDVEQDCASLVLSNAT